MTGAAARLVDPGNADNQGIGPKGVSRNDGGTKTSNSQLGPTGSSITQAGDFHTEASGRFDARGDQRIVLTPVSFGAGDTLTVTFRMHDGVDYAVGAITHGTAAESDWQTAIRAALPGTDLTVVTGTANGAMTITFNDDEFYGRRFPKIQGVVGTGGASATWARHPDGGAVTKRYLGETKYQATTELVGPTIGTITVTPGTDEVQKVAFSAGTDGGTIELGFRRGTTGALAWDAEIAAVQTAIDNAVEQCNGLTAADAPTVRWVTPVIFEVDFVDWDTTDDAVVTYDNTVDDAEASDSLEFAVIDAGASAAARATIIANWVKTIDTFASSVVTAAETTSKQKYSVTIHDAPRGTLATYFTLATTGTTNEDQSCDEIQAQSEEAGWKFTYDSGNFAGRPIRGGLRVISDDLTDGGVAEAATYSVVTPGVLGSASAAYTEQATVGDRVYGEAINDTTGKGGTTAALADAASPVVFAGLVPGAYTLVLRTVADVAYDQVTQVGTITRNMTALSSPSTGAFTMTSA